MLGASGQALIYVYARETSNEANIAGVLTFDEARRIAVNVAKLPKLLAVKEDRQSRRRMGFNKTISTHALGMTVGLSIGFIASPKLAQK